ncbi:MAG: hypothetical protein JSU74_07690 [Candidatus Zixiibacteriota bacterium]|nr:MAG: hypothetical protein JSU74_07690 [candidate division Zixibacteria bacterium]
MRKRINLRRPNEFEPTGDTLANDYRSHESESQLSLFELGATLIRRRRFIVFPVLGVMALTALMLLLTPNKYTSTVTILPSGETDKLSGLNSLAGMSGIIATDENSSDLYPEVLMSRPIKDAVLDRTYSFRRDGQATTLTLQEYFGKNDRDLLCSSLNKIAGFSVDKKTGIIHLAVETEYPALSQAILSAYVSELENFNLHKRRSQARQNEKYLARQLESKRAQLSVAEDELEQFQMENRNWNVTSNPEIIKTLTQLEREVEIYSQAYLLLTKEYEMAKFEAQKDVPIVRLLGQPSLPTQKSGPFRTMTLALVGILALLAMTLLVLALEGIKKMSTGTDQEAYQNLRQNLTTAFPRTLDTINRLKRTERELV